MINIEKNLAQRNFLKTHKLQKNKKHCFRESVYLNN